MGNTAVRVDLTVELDLDRWAQGYDLPTSVVRDDIRRALQLVIQDWLRESMGFTGAVVRVNATNYRPTRLSNGKDNW